VLNWHSYLGHVVIPKTSNEGRLKENITFDDFALSDEEYK